MRAMVRLFNNCREGFNEQFGMRQLEKLYDAYKACGWDIAPDRWTARQVREALRGVLPQWDDEERPMYRIDRVA